MAIPRCASPTVGRGPAKATERAPRNRATAIDPRIAGYRASAAVARYCHIAAGEMYGTHRTYGYAYGGSGA